MEKLYKKNFPNIVFVSSTLDEYNDYKETNEPKDEIIINYKML